MSKQTELAQVADTITVDSGNVGIGAVPLTSGNIPDLTIAHTGHGLGLGYQGATLPTAAGMYTSNSTNFGQAYGSLVVQSRTDYSGYSITFRNNGGERMRIDSAGRVTTPYQPAFKAYLQSDYAINEGGTYYKVPHGGSEFNIGGHYSTSNAKFTAPVAGTYFFYATAIFEGFGASENFRMIMQIRRNGNTNDKSGLSTGGSANSVHDDSEVQISGLIYLNANDYVEHWVSKVGGTDNAGNIWGSSSSMPWTSFSGYLVG